MICEAARLANGCIPEPAPLRRQQIHLTASAPVCAPPPGPGKRASLERSTMDREEMTTPRAEVAQQMPPVRRVHRHSHRLYIGRLSRRVDRHSSLPDCHGRGLSADHTFAAGEPVAEADEAVAHPFGLAGRGRLPPRVELAIMKSSAHLLARMARGAAFLPPKQRSKAFQQMGMALSLLRCIG